MTAIAVVPLALPDEPHVVEARRSPLDAEAALLGAVAQQLAAFACGWFGTSVLVDRGSFALVDPAGPLADMVGDDLQLVGDDGRTAYVYVVGSTALATPLAVTRRTFLALARLSQDAVNVRVGVL